MPDYVSTVSFQEGMRRTVAWFEADAGRRAADEAWDRGMDGLIAAYETRM
jgi:hypothetical protein